jgi:DNA-binding NtrC family response regulator
MTQTNGRVMVVDDEGDVRKVARMCLEQVGYQVIEAENGEQAIQQIKEGDNPVLLDVIITDINMPNINGLEAIHFFQQEWPHVPLIVMTGHPELESAKELMKRRLVDYLVKPVDKEKLVKTVEKAMGQRELSGIST